MLRSGFILGVSGPAAILTLLVHPMVRQAADQWSPPVAPITAPAAPTAVVPLGLPGTRPALLPVSPAHTASLPRPETRIVPAAPSQTAPTVGDKGSAKPRRMREGCEGAISSLAGPEARRMVPGRCIA